MRQHIIIIYNTNTNTNTNNNNNNNNNKILLLLLLMYSLYASHINYNQTLDENKMTIYINKGGCGKEFIGSINILQICICLLRCLIVCFNEHSAMLSLQHCRKENIEGTDMDGAVDRSQEEQIVLDTYPNSDLLLEILLNNTEVGNLQYRSMPLVLNYNYYADLFYLFGGYY